MAEHEVLVTSGYNGWGNRKSGCEAYGPKGRWATDLDLPGRSGDNVKYGDLLGDHLDEIGCHEGSPFIVIAATTRFARADFERLRADVETFVQGWGNA